MTKEIITNGKEQYELNYEYLTPEQRNQVLRQLGCSVCSGQNRSMNSNIETLQASIQLLTPSSNEIWQTGTIHNITWTAPSISGNVAIHLFKAGAYVDTLSDNMILASTGTFSWSISAGLTAGNDYHIKIESSLNPADWNSDEWDTRRFQLTTASVPTCNASTKVVGQTVNMSANPTGGEAPYTATFKKGSTALGTLATPPYTYDYVTTVADIGLQTFSVETIDACDTPVSCIEYCPITVNAQGLTTITVLPATSTIARYGTVQLSVSCYDQVGQPVTCAPTWSSLNTTVATISATGLVTGVNGGTAEIRTTSGSIYGYSIVTVTCPAPKCNLTVS